MKISNEVKIGLTVLIAIIITLVGFRFMRDVPIFAQAQEIEAKFHRVDGLTEGSIIYLNGVKIGSVKSMELLPTDSVRVVMRIERVTDIPDNSVAYITSLSLIEGKSIVLRKGDSRVFVESGDEIEGVYVDSIVEVFAEKGEELGQDLSATFTELNKFLNQLNETIDDQTRISLNETFNNAARATHTLSEILQDKKQDIDAAIAAASRTMQHIDTLASDNRVKVDSLFYHLEKNVRELEETRKNLDKSLTSLNEILEKVNQGDGTFGKMVNDPSLYNNIDSMAVEMTRLIKGINEEPGRFLRHMKLIEIF
ncbi:MAG: MlaD family protein [Balneolaceae bacterium]